VSIFFPTKKLSCMIVFSTISHSTRIMHKSEVCSRFFYRLAALAKVGFQNDARVKRGYAALSGSQREDGGWISPYCASQHNWIRSCPFSSYGAALALYSAKNEEYRDPLIKALEFLVWHLSTKQAEEIQRFFYHGHSTIHELLMLTELQVGLGEKPVAGAAGMVDDLLSC